MVTQQQNRKLMGDTHCARCGRREWDVLCAHCDEPRPGDHVPRFWAAWSEAERTLYEEIQTNDRNADALLEGLQAELTPEQAKQVVELDELRFNRSSAVEALVIARLQRYLPGLADLLYWAGPNGMELRDCEP